MAAPITVTRTFLPPIEEYTALLRQVWERGQITNHGEFVRELEGSLAAYFGVPQVLFASNGTITLQLAIRALDLKGEIITTPYSYVASTTTILWERCTPIFTDIDPLTFNIDPKKIEARISKSTSAILATHVYGLPCEVEAIQAIADRHGLKVIYDAAHAFGTNHMGRSIMQHGDVSSCSFHATKLFHTVEGGALIASNEQLMEKLKLMRSFGHVKDEHFIMGINAKNSELHAAMGLVVLRHFSDILARRRHQWQQYAAALSSSGLQKAMIPADTDYNHAYFPLVLNTEGHLFRVMDALAAIDVFPRRYFFPALSTLPYLPVTGGCPIAEDIAHRVICLPLFHDLPNAMIDRIAEAILKIPG